jgi:hypothetical protein
VDTTLSPKEEKRRGKRGEREISISLTLSPKEKKRRGEISKYPRKSLGSLLKTMT